MGLGTSYGYNILGSLLTITQGANVRTFAYNAKNFLTSESHPERATVTHLRDNIGNIKKRTDGTGEIAYTYDGINRLTRMDHGGEFTTFAYDEADNRTSMRNFDSIATYSYDKVDRLTKKTETIRTLTHETSYA